MDPGTREETQQKLDGAILERLVALNAERAAEEQRGLVRWLRPEFQNPEGQKQQNPQVEIDTGDDEAAAVASTDKIKWPKELAEQARAVFAALQKGNAPLSAKELASRFKGGRLDRTEQLLDTLVSLGSAREVGNGC